MGLTPAQMVGIPSLLPTSPASPDVPPGELWGRKSLRVRAEEVQTCGAEHIPLPSAGLSNAHCGV